MLFNPTVQNLKYLKNIFVLQSFLPYIDRCVKRIFPVSHQALVTSDAKFSLNMDSILEHIPMKEKMIIQDDNDANNAVQHDTEEVSYVVDRVSLIDQEIVSSEQQ